MAKNMNPLFGAVTLVSAQAGAEAETVNTMDQAFAALKTYDYGSSRGDLMPIDDAVRTCLGEAAGRKALEQRLAAVLAGKVTPVAKEYVCSKLKLIGSAASLPALVELLADKDLALMAQSVLEAMPCSESLKALRDNLPRLSGLHKVGIINSLKMRRDARSIPALATLIEDSDNQIAGVAAAALGSIGSVEAAHTLQQFQPKVSEAIRLVVADACLACAESLLIDGNRAYALTMYEALTDSRLPKHVQQAARRGRQIAAQRP